jgi:mono/diheme cytochrome c family protein
MRVLCLFVAVAPLILAVTTARAAAETPAERGAYLVNGILNCGNCHSPQEPDGTVSGPPLSGGPAITTPVFTAFPPNITPDPATGIGSWTEAQIVTALREGRTPDGRILRPPMPIGMYRVMSDHDAYAVATYLRSLPPVVSKVPESSYRIATPAGYGPPLGTVPDLDPTDTVAYGSYLAGIGHCMLCHTPLAANGQRDYAHQLGAGGLKMDGLFGSRITPNITPDRETGIGGWSDAEIKTALTKGIAPEGRRLASPMPWRYLSTMHDTDVDAIVAYLRTIPPQHHKVD